MDIFHFHPQTKEFIGIGQADPDPMNEGAFLHPAFSTDVEPPAAEAGKANVWNGAAWTEVADHRDETWWPTTQTFNNLPGVVIDFLGDPAERHLTQTEPPAPPAPPIVVTPRQIRQALTIIGLRAAVETWVQGADQDVKDNWAFAQEFVRTNGMIEAAAEDLGKTPAEIDELFALAKSL